MTKPCCLEDLVDALEARWYEFRSASLLEVVRSWREAHGVDWARRP